jgi:hypothetical protein
MFQAMLHSVGSVLAQGVVALLCCGLLLLLVLPARTDFFEASFANARSVVEPSILTSSCGSLRLAIRPSNLYMTGQVMVRKLTS